MKKLIVLSLTALLLLTACQQQAVQTSSSSTQETRTTSTTVMTTQEEDQTASVVIETQQTSTTVQTDGETEPVLEASSGRMMKPVGDFHRDEEIGDDVGTVYLEGYANLREMDEAFCDENCKKYTYVFFDFLPELDAENKDFQYFMDSNNGNSFVETNGISIGCSENGIIQRTNAFLLEGASMSQSDSKKILESSKEKPILLKLMRKGPVPGREAPECYSHFTDIEVVTVADNV